MKKIPFLILVLTSFSFYLKAQQIKLGPYLQDATQTSVTIMWETDSNTESLVEWGITQDLGNSQSGTSITGSGSSQVHTVTLINLEPDERYYYQTITGSAISEVYDFITPPLAEDEAGFNLALISDTQFDTGNPDKLYEMVHDGLIEYVTENFSDDLPAHLGFVMIPGDLVANGLTYSSWENHFFDPVFPLFCSVPVYPVPGNHEFDTPVFFKYFNLPMNGSSGYKEHWWTKDYSNLRIVGMDSNDGYRIQQQLDWLDSVLTAAAADETIDFVFAQMHHPYKTELWIDGEIDYTGDIIQRMEEFSTTTGKPSIHFFGHTHGYSRGHSRDHSHLWVNVATAAGNVDYWGEYAQNDYPEFSISQDEYGFVFIEVEAGPDPQFTLKRISRGDEFALKDNTLEDVVTIRRYNSNPQIPVALFPVENDTVLPDCLILKANDFFDPDDDGHGDTHWQISTDCSDFLNPDFESWEQYQNWYYEENSQAMESITEEKFSNLLPNSQYCWRVRYRDKALDWSDWSEPVTFFTGESYSQPNLLMNPGAEDGIADWVVVEGELESLESGECNGINPYNGLKYFAVGGICIENEYGAAYQSVDVTDYADEIDSGDGIVNYGGYMSDWNGDDIPAIALHFMDADDQFISGTDTFEITNSSWTLVDEVRPIPEGSRFIRCYITGTRYQGTDNDSYFDDLFLKVGDLVDTCSYYTDTITVVQNFTGISKDIHVYPNPIEETAMVFLPFPSGMEYNIEVYDILGKLVRRFSSEPKFRFNKDGLKQGMYILHATDAKGKVASVRLIIK